LITVVTIIKMKTGKFLSYILRHHPEAIGITLNAHGWVAVNDLIKDCNQNGVPITRQLLESIVAEDDKQRFSFSNDKSYIKANHLQLQPLPPPNILYHGTAQKNIPSIREHGLLRGQRHHVHLSVDAETARKVGNR
jgi:putative RNA 2'-phosphotransferase